VGVKERRGALSDKLLNQVQTRMSIRARILHWPETIMAHPLLALSSQAARRANMEIKCVSCGRNVNLDHRVFEDYEGR